MEYSYGQVWKKHNNISRRRKANYTTVTVGEIDFRTAPKKNATRPWCI